MRRLALAPTLLALAFGGAVTWASQPFGYEHRTAEQGLADASDRTARWGYGIHDPRVD